MKLSGITTFVVGLMLTLLLFSCGTSDSARTNNGGPAKLTIAAAASTQFAVREIADAFSKENNDFKIEVIIGSSGKLTTQITNGAPYDVFFAANMKYADKVFQSGISAGEPQIFGFGVPTFWTMDTTMKLDASGTFLSEAGIEKIAIAEPTNAPYGAMAVNFFKSNNLYDDVKDKLVYGESISQVNEYIMNQGAQVGISAKSIILSPKVELKGLYLPLEKEILGATRSCGIN